MESQKSRGDSPYYSLYILANDARLVNRVEQKGVCILQENDWIRERERLELVLAEVRARLAAARAEFQVVGKNVVRERREFSDEFRFKPDDILETAAIVNQQAALLSEGERRYRHAATSVRELGRLERSPYFGRVDFLEEGASQAEEVYIGVASLRAQDDSFLVYDWRAPIASLYYDHGPGLAGYAAPMGEVRGQMLLKRQFVISEGQLRMMFDTGVTIGDELLMEALSSHSDAEMHGIVATIQREQNQVIRDDVHRLLIVLGVAGSGKTSAALQRVAYLLYRHRDSLKVDQMVLLSPNALFSSYVAAVLPELGEEPIHQTTFQAYFEQRLGKTLRVEDAYTQLEGVLTSGDPGAVSVRLQGIRYKSSTAFQHALDRYATRLRQEGVAFRPVHFHGEEVASPAEMRARFDSFSPEVRVATRVSALRDLLMEKLAAFERRESHADWVEEEIQLLGGDDLQQADLQLRGSKHESDDVNAVHSHLGEKIVRRGLQSLRAWVEHRQFVDVKALYLRLFTDPTLLSELAPAGGVPADWMEICRDTLERLGGAVLPQEDATPFLYLDELVLGAQANPKVRHLMVDEAQDYSPFQLELLRRLFPNARMTLLGDPRQTASAALSVLDCAGDLRADAPGETEIVRLLQSYRSTREIVEFTRSLLPNGEEVIPFDRRGEKPRLVVVDEREDLAAYIAEDILSLQRAGHQTIAVICKTARESEEAFASLHARVALQLIRKDASAFSRGVLVLPGYLAKGLEFDAVIIFDASDRAFGSLQERSLLYSACTRAMHTLHLYAAGSLSPILAAADQTTYLLVRN